MNYQRPEITSMTGYVPGEQPQGGKFVKLNTNENPYACSPAVTRALQETTSEALRRYPDPLGTAFRIQAGEVLGVDPDWILCGNGSDDILTIVTRTFVGGGQAVRYPYPSYVLYRTLAEIQGARYQEIPFQTDWSLGDDFVSTTHHSPPTPDPPRLVYLPNPNSPSGTMISPDEILRLAERLPCPLLVDEAYADFAEENCLALVAKNEKILVSRTLSKGYALAGLRFGFLVAQPQVIEQLRKVKDSYNCDALSIHAAAAAIGDQAWLQTTRAQVVSTRTRLTESLRQLGFTPVESQANFVWAPHPDLAVRPIYEQLKGAHVLVRYMNFPNWGDGLRITVGTDEQVDACLERLRV